MLARRISTPLYRAFFCVTLLALQEELLAFSTAQLADGSGVTSHFVFDPQTRRFFGGRHPLCGSGVTSVMDLMKSPDVARA